VISPATYGLAQQMYTYRGHYAVVHGGAVPGQKSYLIRVPGLGVGVAVMVNDDEFGEGFYLAVQYMVLDRLLGLEPMDWAGK
jgi:hypothetical protein